MHPSTIRNIPILFIIKISQWFMLYMPIVKLFYTENGLNDFDLFLLHAIYSAVIFLVEIPSGYFSDMLGRKRSIIIGLSFGLLGFVTYSFGYGFTGFLIAEIALGIGEGFISGSDSAILYDTLLENKQEKKYLKFEGRISGVGNVAEALAGIVVTLLAFTVMRGYYYIQAMFSAIGLIFSFFLIEPAIHGPVGEIRWSSVLDIVKNSLWKNKKLSQMILFSSLIGFSSLAMAWFAQIYLYEASIPNRYFGITWTLLNAMVAFGSFSSHWIDQKLGASKSLIFILIFIAGGYIVASASITPYGVAFLLLFYFTRGSAHPILKARINMLTESRQRATVLSVRSLLIRIMFALLGPLMGILTEKISLSYALALCGLIILIPGLMLLISIIRQSR